MPRIFQLTASGKTVWVAFDDAHLAELADLAGDLAAAWSKLEAYTARLALLVHIVRHAANDATLERQDAIDGASMKAAVALVEWFKNETRRVYSNFAADDEDRNQVRLVELIERKGGAVTARDIRGMFGGDSDAADAALDALVKAGFGRWEPVSTSPQGGRPTRLFRLLTEPAKTETPENGLNNDGFGFGSNGDPENVEPADDWGDL